ncbi:MAG: PD-(D/E)XK nuclease-like domain-containing protein, partial [Lachnospiraceae bacterium]|nr:PD-(D/E)XK nuclease-like domain-containing protein [Lachnospiraceae bacterium]
MQLNEQNYFSREADQAFFSASQIKSFKKCEAATMTALRGDYVRPMSQALLQGQFVDEALTGDFGEWAMHHPEISKRDGNLKAEFMLCQEMVSRARRDPLFMSFMDGEHQVILTADLFGVPFKAKFDVLGPDKIVDLKTVKDLSAKYLPGQGRVDFATAWDWPLQMAIYQQIYEKVEGVRLPCYLAVITKETPADIRLVQIEQERMDAEMAWLEQALPRYEMIKDGAIDPER